MTDKQGCPLWGTLADIHTTSRDGVFVNSPRAGGKYFLSRSAEMILRSWREPETALLTTWLIDQRRLGSEVPEISSYTLNDVAARRSLTVHERANRILSFVRSRTPAIGKTFQLTRRYLNNEMQSWLEHESFQHCKAWSETVEDDDIRYLFEFLMKQKFLEGRVNASGGNNSGLYAGTEDYFEYIITPEGYAHLAELEVQPTHSQQAFVAMWFDQTLDSVYEKAIEIAIRQAGYEPIRIDRKDHNNKIDDEIIAEIRRSRFMVADFTHGDAGMRGGVYYEAGFARGLGLPVISTCHQELLNKNAIHFDTRQYNHIGWTEDGLEAFKNALTNRISATIGDGPLKMRA